MSQKKAAQASYDVLAVAAQRTEAAGAKPWPFHIGAEQFVLPPEPPAAVLPFLGSFSEALDKAGAENGEIPTEVVTALPGMLDALLGPADAERLAAQRLSIQSVTDLILKYVEETMGGGGLGESAPSPTSSPTTPATPRQTSRRTTK